MSICRTVPLEICTPFQFKRQYHAECTFFVVGLLCVYAQRTDTEEWRVLKKKTSRTRTHCRREYCVCNDHFAYITMLKLHPNHYIFVLFLWGLLFQYARKAKMHSTLTKRDTDTHTQTHTISNVNKLKGKFLMIDMNLHTHTHTQIHAEVVIIIIIFVADVVVVVKFYRPWTECKNKLCGIYRSIFRAIFCAMAIIWFKMRFKLCYNNH